MSRLSRDSMLPYPVGRLSDGQPRAISFDAAKCIGCRQCVEGCKEWNNLRRGNQYAIGSSTWLTIEPPVIEGSAQVWGRKSCMHCEFPACAAVCPVEAITKYEEGPVVIDSAACIACEYCIYACPWHVIGKRDLGGKAAKCTMCNDRLAANQMPFCVQACPVGALDFGPLPKVAGQVKTRTDEIGASVYGEREAGGTHVLHVLTGPPEEHGLAAVGPDRYPKRRIPLAKKVTGLLSIRGGLAGKRRAFANAIYKPWRLKYRYWHRPKAI